MEIPPPESRFCSSCNRQMNLNLFKLDSDLCRFCEVGISRPNVFDPDHARSASIESQLITSTFAPKQKETDETPSLDSSEDILENYSDLGSLDLGLARKDNSPVRVEEPFTSSPNIESTKQVDDQIDD